MSESRPSGDGCGPVARTKAPSEWIPRLLPASSRPQWTDRAELLLLGAVLALAAFTPALDEYGQANAPLAQTIEEFTGGGLCAFRRLTDIPCGGCGLTRAFVQLAHGQFAHAMRLNPISPLVMLWVLGMFAESIALNVFGRRLHLGIPKRWSWRFYGIAGGGFLALAAFRLAGSLA